jgi:hypothetical protein
LNSSKPSVSVRSSRDRTRRQSAAIVVESSPAERKAADRNVGDEVVAHAVGERLG